MSYTDPMGKCPWCLGAIIGGVAGGATTYLAGGSSKEIGASILIGAAAGAVSMGASVFATSALGTTLSNGAIGGLANVATQVSSGTSLNNLDYGSVGVGIISGGFGSLAGLGIGNRAFFRTSVIGNPVGVSIARNRELWQSLIAGTVAEAGLGSALTCH